MKRRYVKRDRVQVRPPLPKDRFIGRELQASNGVQYVVVASGKMPTGDWPHGSGCSLSPLERVTVGNPVVKP